MPNPPPRKRFQIHLSTAIVLMCVAGGLIGMNVFPTTLRDYTCGTVYAIDYGWPLAVVRYGSTLKSTADISYLAIGANVISALTVLALTWLLCESKNRSGAVIANHH